MFDKEYDCSIFAWILHKVKTEMGRTCGAYGERRGAFRTSVGKSEGRRPLGRPRRRWEDNIKMDLREVG